MSRLNHIDPKIAEGEAKILLDQVHSQMGLVPNFMRVFANSPATLAGFMGLNGNLQRGQLSPKTRVRIALATAESNGCQYCVSVHTALAQEVGLDDTEIEAARRGSSSDEKAGAAVAFAQAVLEHMGDVTTTELRNVRTAGFDDGEIVEIISLVGLNILTNLIGKTAQVDIDFPEVPLLGSAVA